MTLQKKTVKISLNEEDTHSDADARDAGVIQERALAYETLSFDTTRKDMLSLVLIKRTMELWRTWHNP